VEIMEIKYILGYCTMSTVYIYGKAGEEQLPEDLKVLSSEI
jgi:hypothetical protein